MRQILRPHPSTRCAAVKQIEVDAHRNAGGGLVLHYTLIGEMAGVRLPAAGPSARADELWRTTCFEAFVREAGAEAYYELNFATSLQWAAYGFSGYREGMRTANEITPELDLNISPTQLELGAHVALAA